LKALVRQSNAVCLISCDKNLIDQVISNNLEHIGDTVLKLTSFKEHTELKIGEYDGTLQILKQPRIHGIIGDLSKFDIYALKLLKHKSGIVVETIHLEPEEDRAGQDENLEQKGASGSTKKKPKNMCEKVDF
jgi:hypothetical protein